MPSSSRQFYDMNVKFYSLANKHNKNLMSMFILILSFFYQKQTFTQAATVSKCFYEGDFTVYCNKTKLPASTLPSESTSPEVMRYARLTNGLQHNETLCSYVPNTSCHRKQPLAECADKPFCHVRNTWASLEPDCQGNSYYTQLDYDCQPAYSLCDSARESINAFSGIIYSPHYPGAFRSNRIEPCYLTVNLPKNHHVEITLDYFDLLKTPSCIGDYLEIQQYIKVSSGNGGDFHLTSGKFLSNKRFKSSNSNNNNNNNGSIFLNTVGDSGRGNSSSDSSGRPALKLNRLSKLDSNGGGSGKQFRPPQQSAKRTGSGGGGGKRPQAEYKWHTLVTVCGKIEKGYVIKATESTINFKFRPLPANHNYLSHVNRQFQGFKIFFQAVPPKPTVDERDEEELTLPAVTKWPATKQNSTNIITTKVFDMESDGSDSDTDRRRNRTILKLPYWTFIIIAVVIALLLIGILLTIIIVIIKCKNSRSKNYSSKKSPPISDSAKSTTVSAAKPPSAGQLKPNLNKTSSAPAPFKTAPPPVATFKLPPPALKSSSLISPPEASTRLEKQPSTVSMPSGAPLKPGGPKASLMEQEPRKMQAERPLLLQDLSSSRLLAKFKQESGGGTNNVSANPPAAPSTAQTEAVKEQLVANTTADTNTNSTSSKKSSSQITPQQSVKGMRSTTAEHQSVLTSSVKPNLLNAGIYGVDTLEEAGVYGADIPVVFKSSSITQSSTVTPKQISRRPSKKDSVVSSSNYNNNNDDSNKTNLTLPSISRNRPSDALKETENQSLIANEEAATESTTNNETESVKKSSQTPKAATSPIVENIKSKIIDDEATFEKDNTVVSFAADLVSPPTSKATGNAKSSGKSHHRKPAFNPLHVILKDKNKYHTTEYI